MSLLRDNAVKLIAVTAVVITLCLAALHVYHVEGLQGYVLSLFVQKWDTQYAPGFTDTAFRRIRQGMSEAEVSRVLPPPLGEVWTYDSAEVLVTFDGDLVDHVDPHVQSPVRIGDRKIEVVGRLGAPSEKSFVYSRRPTDVSYHVRAVVFRDGRVSERIAEVYVD